MNKVTLWLVAIFVVGVVAMAEAQQPEENSTDRIFNLRRPAAIALPNSEAFREGLRQFGLCRRQEHYHRMAICRRKK